MLSQYSELESETVRTERHGCDEVTVRVHNFSIPHSTEMP